MDPAESPGVLPQAAAVSVKAAAAKDVAAICKRRRSFVPDFRWVIMHCSYG
jgi:hypothetical protein